MPLHDRRGDVLRLADEHGWQRETEFTRHGAISDQFQRSNVVLTCFWAQTPWSEARWGGGIVTGPDGSREVVRVERDDGVLAILRS